MPEAKQLPFDLANVPDGYWDRATNPQRLRDLKTSGSRDVMPIPPNMIRIDPEHNPRDYRLPENRAHLNSLKESIRNVGIKEALKCRWEKLNADDRTKSCIVVDGECRLRAVLELIAEGHQIATVPVMQEDCDDEGERIINAIVYNTGKPLSKWELGGGFRKLIKIKGWSKELIAKSTGYPVAFVTEAIELDKCPEDVKFLLSEQAVTPSLAIAVIKKHGKEGAALILKQKAEKAKAEGKKTAARETKPPTNPIKDAAQALIKTLSTADIADLDEPSVEFISVSRKKLRALYLAFNPK